MPFVPGHVAMIGSNLPHNWLSDIIPGERLSHRDVLCHIRPQTMRLLTAAFPVDFRFRDGIAPFAACTCIVR